MQAKSLVGANLKIYINGQLFGIGTAADWNIDYGRKLVFGIDSYLSQEIMSGQVTTNGTIDCIRTKLSGGLEGYGVAPSDQNILLEKYIQITIVDRQTDTVIFNCQNALVMAQSWRTTSGSVMRGNFSFQAISSNNEVT